MGAPRGEEGELARVGVEGVDGEATFALARDDALPVLVLQSVVLAMRLCC